MAFFKFRKGADATAATSTAPESIETMRRRAKHRLLGAAVLVLVAVIGFPILFEAQPRPVAVNITIDIPDKNKVKPLVMPAAPAIPALRNAASGPVEAMPKAAGSASAPVAVRPALPQASASAAKGNVVAATASIGGKEEIVPDQSAAKAEGKNSTSGEVKATDGDKAKALLEGKEPEKTVATEARFVVQVGAFADADRARDVRQKLERAGLKTYTQVVETQDGKRTRVRVGPFASRDQAEQVAEKVKAIELPAVVLAL